MEIIMQYVKNNFQRWSRLTMKAFLLTVVSCLSSSFTPTDKIIPCGTSHTLWDDTITIAKYHDDSVLIILEDEHDDPEDPDVSEDPEDQ